MGRKNFGKNFEGWVITSRKIKNLCLPDGAAWVWPLGAFVHARVYGLRGRVNPWYPEII